MLIDLICLCFVIMGVILLILGNLNIRKNKNPIEKTTVNSSNFAVLIPARDESLVIENLLKSLKNQTVKFSMQDVYVIVETKEDKTVEICQKYNATVIIRTTKKQRKGYALDEALKQIKKEYDLYFIFDADNVLDKNYFKEMLKTYKQGYDIGVGYRNCKNGNDNVISACSSLTFSMINTLGNDFRNKYNANIIVSGTGFYIKGSWIKKWQGYPFHSLTEDYELSLYSILHDLTTYYNDNAIFYDEQPTKYSQTVKQRTRWIKGYFDSRKKYIPLIVKSMEKDKKNYGSKYSACLGVRAYIYLAIGIILYILKTLILLFISMFDKNISIYIVLIFLLGVVLIAYLIMMIITYKMIKKDKLDLNKKTKIKTIFYNPIYLTTYVGCALRAVFKKNITWDKIEHKVNSKIVIEK